MRPLSGQTEVMSDQTRIIRTVVKGLIARTKEGSKDKWKRVRLVTKKGSDNGLLFQFEDIKVRKWTIQLSEAVPEEPAFQIKCQTAKGKDVPYEADKYSCNQTQIVINNTQKARLYIFVNFSLDFSELPELEHIEDKESLKQINYIKLFIFKQFCI